MAPPSAFITHELPGRARLRVPSRVRDRAWFQSVLEPLAGIEGVESIQANPLAGSILIRHSGPLELILQGAMQRGLFTVSEPECPQVDPIQDRVVRSIQTAGGRILHATAGRADLTGAAVGGLLGVSLLQVVRGKWVPSAMSLAACAAGLAWMRGNKPDVGR